MTSRSLTDELADVAEAVIEQGLPWTLRIEPGESPADRAMMIDAHAAVRDELRDRGFTIRTSVEEVRVDEVVLDADGLPIAAGTYLAIGAHPEDD